MRFANALQAPFARLAVRRPATMSTLFSVPLGFDIMISHNMHKYEYDYKVRKDKRQPEFCLTNIECMTSRLNIRLQNNCKQNRSIDICMYGNKIS